MQEEEKKVKRAYTRTETSPRNRLSSINFKKSNSIQAMHNDRDLPPSYLIGEDFEINRNSTEALELKNQIITEAIKAYNEKKPAKAPAFKAKSYEWSAVVNLKPESTMQDLEELASHFNQKYGFQCYQIAIHRDEGHLNEKGEKVINHHAHLEFITLDKETGKNNYNRQKISPKVLRQIQSEVAEILQMQRGQDKRLSGVKRIEPRKYAQMKEQEKANTKELKQELETLKNEALNAKESLEQQREQSLSKKAIKELIEDFRKQSIGKGYPKEFFRELSDLKQNTQLSTQELLKTTLENLAKAYDETLKIKNSKIDSLESDLKQKEQKNEELLKKINEMDLRGNSELLKRENENKVNYSNDIIQSCVYALNSSFSDKIYNKLYKKIVQAENEKQKQERIKIFESRLEALKEVSLNKFTEWEQENPNHKEILKNYKESLTKEKAKQQEQGLARGY